MEIYNELVINRPIEEVFDFLSNFENIPRWNYYVLSVKKITDGPIVIGSVFHQKRKNDSQTYKIVDFEFPTLVSIETLPPERHLIMRFKLSSLGPSTKIEDAWTITAPKLIAWFVKSRIQAAVKENLQKLKILLEHGQVILQDGRVSPR